MRETATAILNSQTTPWEALAKDHGPCRLFDFSTFGRPSRKILLLAQPAANSIAAPYCARCLANAWVMPKHHRPPRTCRSSRRLPCLGRRRFFCSGPFHAGHLVQLALCRRAGHAGTPTSPASCCLACLNRLFCTGVIAALYCM